MWRAPAARSYLRRRAVVSKLLHPLVNSQVPCDGILISVVQPNDEPLFRIFNSWVSSKSHVYQTLRFSSSNAFENLEDLQSESSTTEADKSAEDYDFSSTNMIDESTTFASPEFESRDPVFDEVAGSCEINGGSDENFVEDEGVEKVKENDVETVERLLSLLQSRGTITEPLDYHFEDMGLILSEVFVLKVLATPCVPAQNLISFARWALKKLNFKVTTLVMDSLVGTICQENNKMHAYALWDLVNEVEGKEGLVSTEILNNLIVQFSRLGKGKVAFDVFSKFEKFGCVLNADSYYFAIQALCERSFYDWAFLVCEKMLEADNLPNGERVGNIISYLCKGNRAKDAHLVYVYAKDKKIYPPKRAVNVLISSLSRIKRTKKETEKEIDKELDKETVSLALAMLDDYSGTDRKYAIKPFSAVIKKLCWIKDIGRAEKLLHEMICEGPPPGNNVFNCVINELSKAGDMDGALKTMKLMENRGLKPDVYTYSVIMSGYVRDGAMEKACEMYDEAKKRHSKLTPVTYHTLIRGFCRLEQFDKAVSFLGEMKQYGVQPNHDEYNKLIKSLCLKALDWKAAEKLQNEMREMDLVLNGRTSTLISAVKQLKEGGDTEVLSL